MNRQHTLHSNVVKEWFEAQEKSYALLRNSQNSLQDISQDQISQLFEFAMNVLWQSAHPGLSFLTLSIILDRALFNTTEHYPYLSALKIDETGLHFDELRDLIAIKKISDKDLIDGFQYIMIEFLKIVGSLTAEIISTFLHANLTKVSILNVLSKSAQSDER